MYVALASAITAGNHFLRFFICSLSFQFSLFVQFSLSLWERSTIKEMLSVPFSGLDLASYYNRRASVAPSQFATSGYGIRFSAPHLLLRLSIHEDRKRQGKDDTQCERDPMACITGANFATLGPTNQLVGEHY
jgi:hypothetical protein